MGEFMTCDQVPESWLDRCTDNGYERYVDEDGNRRYADNDRLVSDMPFRPCARCGHYPNEDGDDWCIQGLGRVVNACCGHGTHDGYVMFDDGTTLRGRFEVERPKEPLPQSNFDRTARSPEALAKMRVRYVSHPFQQIVVEEVLDGTWDYPSKTHVFSSTQEYLDWLKEESE